MSTEWIRMMEQSLTDSYFKSLDEFFKITNVASRPAIPDVKIETFPYDVIDTDGSVKLLHYRPLVNKSSKSPETPLLIIYAMINRYYILDLQHDKSVIKHYLDRGIDVYVVDWGDPGPEDMYNTINDYMEYMDRIVNLIREKHSVEKITLQGYCMGGTFSAIYSSLHPEKVKNLILQAAGIDFSTQAGIINIWGKYIDPDRIVDTYGNVPSEVLNLGFLMIDPVRLMYDKYVQFYQNSKDDDYVKNFIRMEKWIFDSPDVPGEVYRQFIKDLYQRNLLVKNEFEVEPGTMVDLKKIDMPLLTIVGENDTLIPPDSTTPIMNLVSSTDKTTLAVKSGHIGISVSTKAHKELWPKVADWIVERSRNGSPATPSAPPRKTRGKRSAKLS